MLADPARSQVVLVTLPETTPVNELIETAYSLEERVGVQLGPVVVNGVDDGAAAARPTVDAGPAGSRCRVPRRARRELHARASSARLRDVAGDRPAPTSPTWSTAGLDADHIDQLAESLL